MNVKLDDIHTWDLRTIMERMTELHAILRRNPTEGQYTEFKQLMTRLRDCGIECNTLVDDEIVFWQRQK